MGNALGASVIKCLESLDHSQQHASNNTGPSSTSSRLQLGIIPASTAASLPAKVDPVAQECAPARRRAPTAAHERRAPTAAHERDVAGWIAMTALVAVAAASLAHISSMPFQDLTPADAGDRALVVLLCSLLLRVLYGIRALRRESRQAVRTAALPPKDSSPSADGPLLASSAAESAAPRFPTLELVQLRHGAARGTPFSANSRQPIKLESEIFEGVGLVMLRPPSREVDAYYHDRMFDKSVQNGTFDWRNGEPLEMEFQMQGMFKKAPRGTLYLGVELELDEPISFGALGRMVSSGILTFIKQFFWVHVSFGTKATPSGDSTQRQKLRQLPHIVTPLWTSADQLVVSPPGQALPELGRPIVEQNVQARKASRENWGQPGATFTFTFNTFYLNLPKWKIVRWGGPEVRIDNFWKYGTPLRFVIYASQAARDADHNHYENEYVFGVSARPVE
jgi:hypothetical protein